MSDIKAARLKLREIARTLRAKKLRNLASEILEIVNDELYRRKAARRMPNKSKPITRDMKRRVIELVESTDMHSSEIAAELGINPGRVSEIIQGDR